jgi:hypothetical protein
VFITAVTLPPALNSWFITKKLEDVPLANLPPSYRAPRPDYEQIDRMNWAGQGIPALFRRGGMVSHHSRRIHTTKRRFGKVFPREQCSNIHHRGEFSKAGV